MDDVCKDEYMDGGREGWSEREMNGWMEEWMD
jgi:hypothetical protein